MVTLNYHLVVDKLHPHPKYMGNIFLQNIFSFSFIDVALGKTVNTKEKPLL